MRIRSIKPEFWRSDDIDALSIPDRLLFIGLWSYVDDSGIGVDRESSITADLFAGDLSREPQETSVRVHGGLKRLETAGLITRYAARGKRWLHITNWAKHQRINRPTESNRPAPTSDDAEIHEPDSEGSVRTHADSPFGTGEQGSRGVTTSITDADAPADTKTLDDRFAEFWSPWPRKIAKQKARLKYRAAVKKGAKPEHINAAAAAQIAAWRAEAKELQFIPHPTTWLEQGRYDDEVEHVHPNQTVLSVVPDLPVSFEDIRANADLEQLARLLGRTVYAQPQPPSDQTPPAQWRHDRAVELIDAHEAEIRNALERRAG